MSRPRSSSRRSKYRRWSCRISYPRQSRSCTIGTCVTCETSFRVYAWPIQTTTQTLRRCSDCTSMKLTECIPIDSLPRTKLPSSTPSLLTLPRVLSDRMPYRLLLSIEMSVAVAKATAVTAQHLNNPRPSYTPTLSTVPWTEHICPCHLIGSFGMFWTPS